MRPSRTTSDWASTAIGLGCFLCLPLAAGVETVTTSYTYNGDGALTSMTVEGGSGAGTTYLTWDNFTPDASDPATGTLSQGNGNLASIGAQPGGVPQFTFDERDRLSSYQAAQSDPAQSYDYSAENLLRQTALGSDALKFYYAGASGRVINQNQSATGLMSGRLAAGRYLSDGTEQVLVLPRKDTAGLYSPSAKTLEPYAYDPFGAPKEGPTQAGEGYDLAKNPFQYAGEYRDPVWGGYYLRARWYDPDLPAFISRDPVQNISRYAYGGGNPVMHVDPGGKNFMHTLGKFFAGMNRDLNKGIGGAFARIFFAPFMGPLAIVGEPGAFWHAIEHDTSGIDVFLALGIVSEGVGGYMDYSAVKDVVRVSRARRYGMRTLSDLGLGLGQSIAAGAHRGWHHFDWRTFGQGMELLFGANVGYRGLLGLNVRSGYRNRTELGDLIDEFNRTAKHGETLVFRTWDQVPGNKFLNNLPVPKDAPLLEAGGLGSYHERLVVIRYLDRANGPENVVATTEYEELGVRRYHERTAPGNAEDLLTSRGRRYQLVGREPPTTSLREFFSNPIGGALAYDDDAPDIFDGPGNARYNVLRNNCHDHAFAVLKRMGLR